MISLSLSGECFAADDEDIETTIECDDTGPNTNELSGLERDVFIVWE